MATNTATNLAILEINDAALALHAGDELLASSPGYAVVETAELLLGEEARGRARINPRNSFNRFWAQLDQQPLRIASGRARHHADLAYFHLQSLLRSAGPADEYLVAVPAGSDSATLALLLGIAQSLEMKVTGFVAAALLAPARPAQAEVFSVFDIGLHAVSESRLESGDALGIASQRLIGRQGLAWLHDAWAARISRRLVREARFDPLHDARVEQRLYGHLDAWQQAALSRGPVRVEMQAGERVHAVDVELSEWTEAGAELYAAIRSAIEAAPGRVLLSQRLAELPGLLDGITREINLFTPADLARTATAQARHIRSDASAPAFVTRLPVNRDEAESAPPSAPAHVDSASLPAATHALRDAVALPISGLRPVLENGEMQLRADGDAFLLHPGIADIQLNGQTLVQPARLLPGDELAIDSQRWQLIRVEG